MHQFKRHSIKKKTIIFNAALFCIFLFFLPAVISCQKGAENKITVISEYRDYNENSTTAVEEGFTVEEQEADTQLHLEDNESSNDKEDIITKEELLKYMPNELGQVMVLMYHKIGDTESDWVRTPENFHKDLLNLYKNGYRLINLLDYVKGDMDIEAGKSPVILTFDDSTQGQFNFIETDKGIILDPDCAVAILEDFCSQFPDFGKGATFFICYPYPFGQVNYIEDKFNFLVNNGYEIGNHTYSHVNLSEISNEDVKMEIALSALKTNEILPGYEVRSIALTYGQYPQEKDILVEGTFDDYSYYNEAVLLIGSNPSPSPFALDFDFTGIPRIKASELDVDNQGLYDWIDYFEKYPEYLSQGETISESVLEVFRVHASRRALHRVKDIEAGLNQIGQDGDY